jgi:trk system potassium uptake protein TrkH
VLFSGTLLPPILISWIYRDGAAQSFFSALVTTLVTGLVLWLITKRESQDLRFREGFMVVVLFWTVLATFGSIPFLLVSTPALSFTDAFFESMSGLTTTGATILTNIDHLPKSILYYRQQLQWLGGMGIIVLAVAIMPMLGVGGMQLYRAETPGPMKDTKLTPRITETAKALWFIYLGLTVICAFSYWLAGMNVFDAVGHSFSTVAIGGFSTHDDSLGFFNNAAIDTVAIVFMVIAGVNFALHFVGWRSRSVAAYLSDPEAIVFVAILFAVSVLVITILSAAATFDTPEQTLRQGLFQVVSIATTTGFTTGGYNWWPSFLPLLLLILSFVGGCAGSTAGGVKVIRVILLYKQARREIVRLIHPSALLAIKLGGKPVPDSVIQAVWAFFSLYILCFTVLGLAVAATGLDWVTTFSAVAACMNNLGPGLGEVAVNYASVGMVGKWILCIAMLLGRLELFTLLVLFTATFWRS